MRILHVVSMGYLAGGAEKSVKLLSDNLKKRGHEVKILSTDYNSQQPHFSDYESRHIQGGPLHHLWSLNAYRTMRRVIAEFKPEIVHFHTMGGFSPSVLFALNGTPAVLTVHGPEAYTLTMLEWYLNAQAFKGDVSIKNLTFVGRAHYWFFRYLQRPLYKFGFRNLGVIIAPSRYIAGRLAREGYDVPIQQIYNGIELPAKKPLPRALALLFVGRLEHVKGLDVLLRALPDVLRHLPKVTLRVVGDGPDRRRLQELTAMLGLSDAVTFTGWQKSAVNEYNEARLVVIPSIWPENLPTVAIEALAVGRPIVGTRVGGIPELVLDGVSGCIVPANDPEAMTQAIIDLLQDTGLSAKAAAATKSAERFGISGFIDSIEEIYKGLIK